jgi:hypothetical protein
VSEQTVLLVCCHAITPYDVLGLCQSKQTYCCAVTPSHRMMWWFCVRANRPTGVLSHRMMWWVRVSTNRPTVVLSHCMMWWVCVSTNRPTVVLSHRMMWWVCVSANRPTVVLSHRMMWWVCVRANRPTDVLSHSRKRSSQHAVYFICSLKENQFMLQCTQLYRAFHYTVKMTSFGLSCNVWGKTEGDET